MQSLTTTERTPRSPPSENAYKCRICNKIFNSRYAFAVHINSHELKCGNCKCIYKTWKKFKNHFEFCPRRNGITVIFPRSSNRPIREPKLPHKCTLCRKRYEKYKHLFNHQVERCTKRYISENWVVKI